MRWYAKWAMASALAIGAVHGAACTSGSGQNSAIDTSSVKDVLLQGSATAPALVRMLAGDPLRSPAGPQITDPPNDTVALASDVITFKWKPGGATARSLLPAERPAPPAWLRDLLGPERAAAAATPAMTGHGYYLLFSTDDEPTLLRVFTTETSYTPDKAAWGTLVAAGMWTKLVIASADFADDVMVPGSGPYIGDPIEFCIEGE